jgi:class 3 adenylate cyclase
VAQLPTGTVTFVFTDVEGSTRLLKHARQAYGGLLARHHELVRDAIEQQGGREVDTQGEAFFVAYARAKDAVASAIELQRAHAAEAWPEGSEIRVRIGIHTAEPELRSDGYFGLGLHRAARICAVGHGGQVLLSRSAAGLVDEDEIPDIEVRDLGEHLLKDLERRERIYQLVAPGLREEFPPLKTVTELARRAGGDRPPEGTVTFLATDVVGYTEVMRALGRRIGVWIERYEDICTRAIERAGGTVVEQVGDSLVASFSRASDAVRAATALQPALEAATWPSDAPVVKVGLHTGEIERLRSRYVGFALIRALAVCGEARGGEVLLSQATRGVIDESGIPGLRLEPVGERELTTFDGPVALYRAEPG